MEPLNLMVSLSQHADDNRGHRHGLSTPAGRKHRARRTNRSTDPRGSLPTRLYAALRLTPNRGLTS
jgi:hypothetical protein